MLSISDYLNPTGCVTPSRMVTSKWETGFDTSCMVKTQTQYHQPVHMSHQKKELLVPPVSASEAKVRQRESTITTSNLLAFMRVKKKETTCLQHLQEVLPCCLMKINFIAIQIYILQLSLSVYNTIAFPRPHVFWPFIHDSMGLFNNFNTFITLKIT